MLRDPYRLDPEIDADGSGRGVLGFSLSGRSAEVLDGLARAARRGLPTCRVGAGGPVPPDVAVPALDGPPALAHLVFAAVVPTLHLGHASPAPRPASPDSGLRDFLAEMLDTLQIPIFVAVDDGLEAKRLCALWLELIGRPAFVARFPDFTHDLLWSFERSRDNRFAWILRQPQEDLSDRRFVRLLLWLRKRGMPHHLLGARDGEGGAVAGLLDDAELFRSLLADRGRPLPRNLEMDDDAKVTSR